MLILLHKNINKKHFVMLLPILGYKQHKVNKNIFERDLMFFFKKNFQDKGPYFV